MSCSNAVTALKKREEEQINIIHARSIQLGVYAGTKKASASKIEGTWIEACIQLNDNWLPILGKVCHGSELTQIGQLELAA